MDVYNSLGFGFLEIIYKDAMEYEFNERGILYNREHKLPIFYKGVQMKRTFFSDFFVFNSIIVEVKANSEGISEESISQTLNYLKASRARLGLIINFGKARLTYKRLVF